MEDYQKALATLLVVFATGVALNYHGPTIKKKLKDLVQTQTSPLDDGLNLVGIKDKADQLERVGTPEAKHTLQVLSEKTNALEAFKAWIEVEKARQFNEDTDVHYLETVWSVLMQHHARVGGRMTENWGMVGFQGKDPVTDLRGMGMFGLINFVDFVERNPEEARDILKTCCVHPTKGFPMACTGINFSASIVDLLQQGLFDGLWYELGGPQESDLDKFNRIYAHIFRSFARSWKEEDPDSVMEFRRVFSALMHGLIDQAQADPTCRFIDPLSANKEL